MTYMKKNDSIEYTKEIICPYCGYNFSDSWKYDKEYIGLVRCKICTKEFYAQKNPPDTFSSFKPHYGTCSCCGEPDVIVENYQSAFLKVDSIGVKCCLDKEIKRAEE